MKAIIKGTKIKREYYLGCENPYIIWGIKNKLDVHSSSDDRGRVKSVDTFIEKTVVEETTKITRELTIGEYIAIGDLEYEIKKVAHDTEGNLIYYIDHEEVIEDEASKIEAEKLLEVRRAVLLEREKKNKENKKTEGNIISDASSEADYKKEQPKYKFW